MDLGCVNTKLQGENQEYWIHLQSLSSLDKYPGKYSRVPVVEPITVLIHGSNSQTTRQSCRREALRQ
jgi:hypothetical protein